MKTNILTKTAQITLSLTAASILLSGCGSSNIDEVYDRSEEAQTQSDYTVQVVDDAVRGARILANECTGYEEKSDGYYTLTGCSSRPKAIISEEGYITLGDKNITMAFPLMLNTTNMLKQSTQYTATPLTTLLATVNDYAELDKLKSSLGFSSIEDMFKDTNATRDLQRTLNSFFIEAKESGVDINNFSDFTKDFREMIVKADDQSGGVNTLKAAKTKLKEDFDANIDKYMNKYGVVFSGFVTSTDYTSENGSEALLKSIGAKFQGDKDQIVFSGFIFDDIIGKGNSSKYTSNANITLKNLNTNTLLEIDEDTNVTTDDYGKYILKVAKDDIIANNSYLLQGTVTNSTGKLIELNSILTGEELLAKFKANLNTADVPDITISNVTTAKTAILEQSGVTLTNTNDVIEKKKEIEKQKTTLLDVATGIKTIIDGSASTTNSQNTFDYIKTTIATDGTFTKPNDMVTDFNTFKTKIETNKTLVTQLTSTKYEKFNISRDDVKSKNIVFKIAHKNFPMSIMLFENSSYLLESKDDDLTPKFEVGKWSINANGDLVLTNIENNTISTITLDGITLGKATYNTAGQFTGTTSNPKGSIKIEDEVFNLNIITLTDIDLTKNFPPMVEFTNDNIKNKKFFEVYLENGEYEDAVYIFNSTGTSVDYAEDVKNETGKIQKAVSITNGILTLGTDTFRIKKAYPTRLVVSKNENANEETDLFFSAVDVAASKEIRTYDTSTYKTPITSGSIDKEGSNSTISSDLSTLRAIPANTNDYTKSYISKIAPFDNIYDIGAKADITVTENLGDSQRQRGVVSTRYWLPSCSGVDNQGIFVVNVQVRNNKVVYMLQVKDVATGKEYDILDTPVTMIEENTLNKKYSIMTLMLKNQIAIQLSDGINAYYQYIDLPTLWGAKPTNLKYFKYPTALKNTAISAVLYDDGTENLFKGKMNTPISVKSENLYVINGKNENNYEGSQSSVCSTATSSGGTSAPSTTSIASLENDLEDTSLSDFNLWMNMTTSTYDSLQPIASTFFNTPFGDMWYKSNSSNERELGKSDNFVSGSTITFTENEKQIYSGVESVDPTKVNSYAISKSGNIYTLVDNEGGDKELKIIKEYDVNALQTLFNSKGLSTLGSLLDSNDRAIFLAVKQLEDGIDFDRKEDNGGAVFSTLSQFVTTHSGNSYFWDKDGYSYTGLAFATGSTGNSGTLVETSYNPNTQQHSSTNAGTWQIGNDGVLRISVISALAPYYHTNEVWKVIANEVWVGEEKKLGDNDGGLLFNQSALNKLYNYFNTLYNQ